MKEEIIFNGVKYRLLSKGRYYLSQSTTNKGRKGAKGLHVAIWEFYNNKKVPNGYVIHHKDGNYKNNSIENLACLSAQEHFELHKKQKTQKGKSPEQIEHLNKIRKLSKEWHRSEQGKKWHKQHVLNSLSKTWDFRELRTCVICGKTYIAKARHSKYCCKQCQTKAYRLRKKELNATLQQTKTI